MTFGEDVIQELALLGVVQVLLSYQQFRGSHNCSDGCLELVGGVGQKPLLIFLQSLALSNVAVALQNYSTVSCGH
jgi:hypothetical protein